MKMNISKIKSIIPGLLFLFGCSSSYPPLETVDSVDVNRYLGKWYEIARLPNSFQKECDCTTAEYSLIDSTTIRVINKCLKNGELDDANGKAFVVEGSKNSKLRVQFFWPFRGDYWIIELDKENYNFALVGTPSRKYLWILSRTAKMDKVTLQKLISAASGKGFNTSELIYTKQDCN
jgi:apolipoprotein D and lipocalin family protein